MTVPSLGLNIPVKPRWKRTELLEWAILECGNGRYSLAHSSVAPVQDLSHLPGGPYTLRIAGENPWGHPGLKDTVAALYNAAPENVLLAQGASEANFLIAGAVLRDGGTAIVETPVYQPILRVAEFFADRVRRLGRRLDNRCLLDLDELRGLIDEQTKLIWLTNLHNPTGIHMSGDFLREVVAVAAEVGAVVLVDEVYHPMREPEYGRHAFSNGAVSVNSMDKAYGLSDIRVGWAVAPAEIVSRAYGFYRLLGAHQPNVTEDLANQILNDPRACEFFASRRAEANLGRALYDDFLGRFPEAEYIRPDGGINGLLALPPGSDDAQFIVALQQRYDTTAFPGSLFELPGTIRVSFGGDRKLTREAFTRLGALYREW